ncbi:zinc transporter ZntB [Bowmanella sp. JS7-9]|uniref:Zinc transporter ZntB n=1 Tax=Pseudobowmanella zhangzhouensis TaxID=1537679 RepID=A0ABW1XJ66_9ALTE|nr:zinc transporter ZntB [Bowmanella sp. JS7-9]
MHNKAFLIDAWQFHEGKAQRYSAEHAPAADVQIWYHCDRNDKGLTAWLQSEGIDHGIISTLLAEDTRPRFQQFDDGESMLIVRGVNLNEGSEPDDMLSIRFLFVGNRLYSMRRVPSKAVTGVRELLATGQGPKSLEELITTIIEQLHMRIENFLDPIEDFIDELDSDVVNSKRIQELNDVKRRLLKLNRFLKPQSYALDALHKANLSRFKKFKVRLDHQRDTLLRILEGIEFDLAQINLVSESMQQITADRMNRNTYMLSVIAGVFLPLGFLTGLFGINIGGMPGVENGDAFTIFCIAMGIISAGVLLVFRRLKFV